MEHMSEGRHSQSPACRGGEARGPGQVCLRAEAGRRGAGASQALGTVGHGFSNPTGSEDRPPWANGVGELREGVGSTQGGGPQAPSLAGGPRQLTCRRPLFVGKKTELSYSSRIVRTQPGKNRAPVWLPGAQSDHPATLHPEVEPGQAAGQEDVTNGPALLRSEKLRQSGRVHQAAVSVTYEL